MTPAELAAEITAGWRSIEADVRHSDETPLSLRRTDSVNIGGEMVPWVRDRIEQAIRHAVAAERAACAKIADQHAKDCVAMFDPDKASVASHIAEIIRARPKE